jgi:hypothetical protein
MFPPHDPPVDPNQAADRSRSPSQCATVRAEPAMRAAEPPAETTAPPGEIPESPARA